jgi:hypothetical protein
MKIVSLGLPRRLRPAIFDIRVKNLMPARFSTVKFV